MKNNIQKQIQELDKLRKSAEEAIKKYNKLSKKIQFETRLGLATSQTFFEDDECADEDDEKIEKPKDLDEYLEEHDGCAANYINIQPLGSDAWFPSSICAGY